MKLNFFHNALIVILSLGWMINSITAQVYVNQAGYITGKNKFVYLSTTSDSFFIHNNVDGSIVYKNKSALWKTNDPSTGLTIYRGGFTEFDQSGKFYITDKLGNKSWSFEISDTVFNTVLKKSLKGFYFQRCGTQLLSTHAGSYSHPACHINDGTFHSTTGLSGKLSAGGGWHDAGDYGKYIVNAGITCGTLLMAYELFPEKFNYDDSNIPESGNGIPDILDEVKYELDWFFKMQREDGGVYFKVTRLQFSGFVMPQTDNATRYIYVVSSTATADFAAVMARAYRNFLQFDQAYADKCLDAAKKAWEFLEANPSIVPTGGFRNPSDTGTGSYGNGDDSDERLWAATELMISTGEQKFDSYFKSKYNSSIFSSSMSWPNVRPLAHLSYLTGSFSNSSQTIKDQLKQALVNYCNNLLTQVNNDGFNLTLKSTEYNWGSNSEVLNRALLLIIGYEQNRDQKFYDAALQQLNYILGTNVHNICFVTGIGDKHMMKPHHRPSGADGILEPVPGLVAGGPNSRLQDKILSDMFNTSTPAAKCYVDHVDSYASNEICINWNAPLVFVSGYFANIKTHTSSGSIDSTIPQNFQLDQNYPNPFNPSTMIGYKLKTAEHVSLKVFDTLGRKISTLVDEDQTAGNYNVLFNGLSETNHRQLPSGIYFYELRTGSFSQTKKMILLR